MQLRRLFDPTTDHDIYQNLSDPWFLNKQVLQKLHLLGCQTPQDKKIAYQSVLLQWPPNGCRLVDAFDPRMARIRAAPQPGIFPPETNIQFHGERFLVQVDCLVDQHGSTWINMDQHGHGRNGTHWTCFKTKSGEIKIENVELICDAKSMRCQRVLPKTRPHQLPTLFWFKTHTSTDCNMTIWQKPHGNSISSQETVLFRKQPFVNTTISQQFCEKWNTYFWWREPNWNFHDDTLSKWEAAKIWWIVTRIFRFCSSLSRVPYVWCSSCIFVSSSFTL